MQVVAVFALLALGLSAAYGGDVVEDFNAAALAAIKASNTAPPVAARGLAMLHLAMFDAANAATGSKFQSYLPYDMKLAGINASLAAARAGFVVGFALWPSQSQFFTLYQQQLDSCPPGNGKLNSVKLGSDIANRLIAARANDGSSSSVCMAPDARMSKWQPTPRPAPQGEDFGAPPAFPHWGKVKPFVLPSCEPYRAQAPHPLSSALWARDFNEVKALGAAVGSTRTAEQTEIATFWAGGAGTVTPPGQWNVIARDFIAQRSLSFTLVQRARVFALLNAALADASFAAWDSKYLHYFWRPVTAIRFADFDGNDATEVDYRWRPLLTTPNHPDHTSGHSTFSGAASHVLDSLFAGQNLSFSTSSEDFNPPRQRSFASFDDAAAEAGRSRIFGGIHFQRANEEGLRVGAMIGDYVVFNALQPL